MREIIDPRYMSPDRALAARLLIMYNGSRREVLRVMATDKQSLAAARALIRDDAALGISIVRRSPSAV